MEYTQLPPPAPIVENSKPKKSLPVKIAIGIAIFFGISWVASLITNISNATASHSAPIPAATSHSNVSNEKAETVVWAVTAGPAMQKIVDISTGIDENSDPSVILSACLKLGDAGHDLADGAPATAAGDEARAIESSFSKAATACSDGDFETASTYLHDAVGHMSTLTDELSKIAG
jgi:hypothetical protein